MQHFTYFKNNIHIIISTFIIFVTALSPDAKAQSVVQTVIGPTTGTLTSHFYGPIFRSGNNSNLFNYSRHAYIYTAADLGIPSGSKIIKLEWLKSDTGRVLGDNSFNVWISNTSATSFGASVPWGNLIGGTTLEFSSSTYSISTGANTYIAAPFIDSFTYYGGSIQILTDWTKLGFATGTVPFYRIGATGKAIGIASQNPLNSSSSLLASTYGGNRPTIRITYVTVPPCAGVPNPGNTVASSPGACVGVPFTLSLQNAIQGGLISYLWQSASNATFTTNFLSNIGTNASVIKTQTSNTYYRCIVTCSGGGIDTSTPLLMPMSPSYGCYCSSRSISAADEDIFKFTFGNLKNCSDCNSTAVGFGSVQNIYSNYQSLAPANVQQGATVPFSIEIGICGINNYANRCAIFIDFNQNMLFSDPGELVYSTPVAVAGAHTEVGTIIIPTTALTGLTGLRVLNVEQSSPITSPCLTYSYGETEDYLVNITPSSACIGTPTPGNTLVELPGECAAISSTYALCSGMQVSLTVQNISPYTGMTYQWYNNTGLISGATSAIYLTPSLTANQTYYCNVTCSNSGLSTNSSPMNITMANYLNCYCTSRALNITDEEILNFNLNGISNPSNCTIPATGAGSILNRYSNFTNIGIFAEAELGTSIPFSVFVDDCDVPPAPYFSFGTSIWIDFNHNGSFNDAGEQVFLEPTAIQGPRTITGNIAIPCNAIEGLTRLRVTAAEGFAGATLTSCLAYNFGETEDYLINLTPKKSLIGFNFGTTATSANATSGVPIANLIISSITQGNNANTAQSTLLIGSSNPSNYSGASGQMNAGITARNKNLQLSDTSAYYQMVLTPSAGYQVVLDSIYLGSKSMSTGPTTLDIRTSANNYTNSVGTISATANSTWVYFSKGLTPLASNVPLTIRIYGYVIGGSGSVTTGTTPANWFVDDLKFKVRVKCAPTCNLIASALNTPIICNGGTSTLTVSTTNGNGIINYQLNGGASQTSNIFSNLSAGTYTITVTEENLCTASVVKVITQAPIVSTNNTLTVCNTYTSPYNGNTYTTSGIYITSGITNDGCPRFDTLNLTVNYNSASPPSNVTACGSYLWNANNVTYTASGTYTFTSLNASGCVQTANLQLIIIPHISLNVTECDSYTWLATGITYTQSGIYTHTNGCQISTLNLTIIPSSNSTSAVTSCDNYTWSVNNVTYTASGIYTHVTVCNTLTLNLTITTSTTSTTSADSVCGSYTWLVNNVTYTSSGTYIHIQGCHTSTLNLTIIPNTTSATSTGSVCNSYTWSVNNVTYTSSGTYTHIQGCHTSTLNLTIIPNTTSATSTGSVCNSYTWSVNNITYTASGTYTHVTGCHTATLNVTIIPSTTSATSTGSVCNSYTWSVNNMTYTSSGIYTHVTGCHTATLNVTIIPSTTSATSIGPVCDSYTWSVNNVTYTSSGTYTHVTGCHTSTLNLTIIPSTTSATSTGSVCNSYTWSVNNVTYTTSGTYTHLTGCHTSILNVTIIPSTTSASSVTACGSYTWPLNNVTYTTSGTYIINNICGTDTLILTMNTNTTSASSVTNCNSYTWPLNNVTYTATGIYTHITGCHTTTLMLTIIPSTTSASSVTVCDSYTWSVNNETYTTSGTYTHTSGCHTSTLNLSIIPSTTSTNSVTACASYLWSLNNITYTSTGTYSYVVGCHTSTLNLTIIPSSTSTTSAGSVCNSYIWPVNNQTYTATGIYTHVTGCHTATLNVTIIPTTSSTTSVGPICNSYTWPINNITYTSTGTYTHTVGCHISTLNLIITPSTASTSSANGCGSYTWSVNNFTYTTSGTYLHVADCHTSTLNLTIIPSTASTSLVTQCGFYTWSINNTTYTTSGIYTHTTGCHTYTLNLTIIPGTTSTSSVAVCNSYTWPVNNLTYTASGSYTHLASCQISILNLTVTPNTTSISSLAICDSYTWPVNNVTYTSSGTYTHVTGCHTSILNLTIIPSTASTISANGCDSYTWPVNNLTYTSSGTYTHVTGCQTNTLNLTINTSTTSSSSVSALNSYLWPVNNTSYTASGIYVHTLLNASGCIQTNLLNLTILLPLTLTVIENQAISCFGNNDGSAIAIASGTQPLSYNIDGGLFNNSTGSFAGLTPGYHTFCVKDALGNILCDSLFFSEPSPLTMSFVVDSVVSCLGNDGMLTVNITGGTNLLQGYLTWWTNGNGDTLNDILSNNFALSLMQLPEDFYSVSIEDDNGCKLTATTFLQQVNPIVVNANYLPITCLGGATTIIPSSIGGVPYAPISYLINGNPLATMYPSGSYTITAIDAVGCTGTTLITISEPTTFSTNDTLTVCDTFTWSANGQTYTNSGIYTHVNGCLTSTLYLTINSCATSLNLRLILQGYYDANAHMKPVMSNQGLGINLNLTDTIEVFLYDASPPYSQVTTIKTLLNTDGTANCLFPPITGNYYIGILHRNSVLTWSANPVALGNTAAYYDFSTSATQAFGLNQIEIESGLWALYTGDLNTDENIDLIDSPILEASISNFDYGYYTTDLNGDGNVDLLDYPILEDNINNFIYSIHP